MRIFRQKQAMGTSFPRPEGMPELLHRLLVQRGISSVEEARAFLRPDRSGLNPPERLQGAKEAAELLMEAVHGGEPICVYGDYDVDGVSASSILFLTLRKLGAQVEVYLPSRHEEGYGLNEKAIREIAGRCSYLVTVDCGITSVELVELAKELGLKIAVTDHHRPGETLPDCIVVNPLLGGYPDPFLCGGGVAYKLCELLLGQDAAMELIDIAALATVADIVPLVGENRALVKLGLDRMNRAPRSGLACLREIAGMGDKPFTSGMLGFQIGPRLNASGRIGSARRAFDLLTAQEESKARALAVELNAENELRKQIEEEISRAAMAQLETFDFLEHRAIVLAGEGWNSGVIGLAASRLVEKFHYPTILISLDGETGVGSCRSIPGIDIHKALTAVSGRLVKFGGHEQAAGLTIERAELQGFVRDLDGYLKENIPPQTYVPVTEYDVEAKFSELDAGLVTLMEAFAPTGMGNPAPVFYSRVKVAEAKPVGREGAHLSLRVTDGTNYIRGVAFREGDRAKQLGRDLDVVYSPKISSFGGRNTVELEYKAIENASDGTELPLSEKDASLRAAFLTEVLYNRPYGGSSGETAAVEEIRRLLEESPQGTLLIAADEASARRFSGLDVYAGRYPDDPRAFNALCLLPAGEIPCSYRNVFTLGLPAREGQRMLAVPRAAWLDELPGLDELRRAYVAVKRMLSRPIRASALEDYALSLTQECGLSETCLMACVLIFLDMELVRDEGGFHLKMGEFRKLDPASSAAYRANCILKGGAANE